jgi:succinyl-CoA synthetase beta subunit
MKCDIIANGVCKAAQEIGMKKPIVIRLTGTNADLASKIIEDSPFKMILATDLEDAAEKAVGVAEIVRQANKIKVGLTFGNL